MSYEHDELFKQLGNDLERWLKSVRDWQKIATKSYTIEELVALQNEFKLSCFERPDIIDFLTWLKEREKVL